MALISNQGKPILILSMDRVEEENTQTSKVISANSPDVTDQEREEKKGIIERFKSSDSFIKTIRVPIFIEDAINVQQVGSNSGTGKTIDYIGQEPVFSSFSDSVSVELSIKNNVGDLSVAADLFSAAIQKVFGRVDGASARASFFGHSVCIFNGYITGVNRTTVAGTDQERMNLTFERQKNQQEETVKEESEPQNTDPSGDPPDALPPVEGLSAPTANASSANAGGAVGDKVFYWYNIGALGSVQTAIVPEIFSVDKVNRLDYEIMRASSLDFSGVERQAITVLYDGVYLPLGLNNHYPYYKQKPDSTLGYAVTTKNGWLWLGIEANVV